MEQEAVVALIRDLTTRLSAVAAEFSGRAEQAAFPASQSDTPPADQRDRRALAARLLDERRARRDFLPEELFHEPAWDMLLALYLAHVDRRTLNVKTLVACAEAPVTTSQRWIDHLDRLGLVSRATDQLDRRRIEVSLTQAGQDALEAYLRATPLT